MFLRKKNELICLGFRGKILGVEASIPKNWYKAGESIPITIQLNPQGYKKVVSSISPPSESLIWDQVGWIKATLVNRVIVKAKANEGKEIIIDYGVADEKFDDDTDFDPETPSATKVLNLSIPVLSL